MAKDYRVHGARGGDGERRINDSNRIFSFDSCSSASGHVTRSELIYIDEVDPVHVQVWGRSIGRLHSSVCAPRLATRDGRAATVALPLYRANARNNRTNRGLNYSARATGGGALEIETNAFTLRSHKDHGRAEIGGQGAESAKTNEPARTKRHPSNEFRYNRCLRAQIKLMCTLRHWRERARTQRRALARLTASASHQEARSSAAGKRESSDRICSDYCYGVAYETSHRQPSDTKGTC